MKYQLVIPIIVALAAAAWAQPPLSKAEKKVVKDFEKRAKAYARLREKARNSVPVAKKDSTPEEIERYKDSLYLAVRSARLTAKQGDVFTPAAQVLFRRLIKNQFPSFEKTELRKQVFEADTKGVPLKLNYPYPENKELVAMPPPLLVALPQLPKDLRFRFIGRALVLMDRDGSFIIDFMRDALP
jgi:hypothetical protein